MKQIILLFLLPLVISIVIFIRTKSVISLCEIDSCPDCFGDSICQNIEQVSLLFNSLSYVLYNLLNVKNVYFALYRDDPVVLKKLAHNSEFTLLNKINFETRQGLIDFLTNDVNLKKLRLCDAHSAKVFLNEMSFYNFNVLTYTLRVNPEPLLLQLFNSSEYPVPLFYGSCGRLIVVENAGFPLLTLENNIWNERAYVTYQILQAAVNFTFKHDIFRMYLTDISPDNIVVDEQLNVKFIDLENAILRTKMEG